MIPFFREGDLLSFLTSDLAFTLIEMLTIFIPQYTNVAKISAFK